MTRRLDLRVCLVAALALSLTLVSTASAAFPGRNGRLAVEPLRGGGIVLVGVNGRGAHRICVNVSVCGHPGRPQFSPDGRSIVFAGPAVRVVGTDGICQNCRFGAAAAPAFRGDGTLVTFASGATVFEDSIDGIRQTTVVFLASLGSLRVSAAVWSVRGMLAVAAGGRLWAGMPGGLRSIGSGNSPSWSPDGSRIAFVRHGWIVVLRVSTHTVRRVVRGAAPAFSPDGRSIAFVARRHRVEWIWSSGGRARPVGRVRGLGVDWQPLPSRPAACVPPAGAKVLAQSRQAVVTAERVTNPGAPSEWSTAAMGCLIANGRERLLANSTSNTVDGATDYPLAGVGGTYAGVVAEGTEDHYFFKSLKSVEMFDLRSGAPSGFGGESSDCSLGIVCGIDRVVVGSDGVSAVHVAPVVNADPIRLSCASASFCAASNRFGDVSLSSDPANGPWSAAQVGAQLQKVSCPSASLCVGISNSGSTIYTSANPTGGSSTWTRTQIPGIQQIFDVSCPSTTLCVASASGGNLLVSTDPAGGPGAWSIEPVDGIANIWAVSCPTTSQCFAQDAGDGNVISSSNPTGGPSAWTVRQLVPRGLQKLACDPSSSLCLGVPLSAVSPGLLVSTAPASGPWTTTNSSFLAWDAACPSASLCLAVGQSGVSVSTDPTSGAWTTYALPLTPGSISCPTTSFCAIGTLGGAGDAFISTDPAGGAGTWTRVPADPIDCATTPLACGTEQIIASDRNGVRPLGSSTEFEAQTGPQLTSLSLTGDLLSWNDHGSPTTALLKH